MSKLKNKLLLILGANYETIPLVMTAKELGCIVHVTDYNPAAPAKKYAHVAHDVDCMDIQKLSELCYKFKIDGIMLGVADSLVKSYQLLCAKNNYPCYVSKQQSEILTNKKRFNQLCENFGLPSIPNYKIDLENFDESIKGIEFPVFVKPVDANSGKGMSICENKQDLVIAIEKAKSSSITGQYLVEEYMTCSDILAYYTFVNGKYYLTAIADRYTIMQNNLSSRVCVGAIYDSRYKKLFIETIHEKLTELFKSIDVKNGVFLVSAFVKDNCFYLYDPGFRLQGEAPDIHIQNGISYNQREALVHFALTGEMTSPNQDKVSSFINSLNTHLTLWILLRQGVIKEIQGLNALSKNSNVFYVSQRLFLNDEVKDYDIGTERQVFARIYCKIQDKQSIKNLINEIEDTIDVRGENGESLKINGLKYRLF